MKKIIFILFLLILIPTIVLAWNDCLDGEVDCLYPGDCSKFIDTDGDKICDHSQLAPENRINSNIENNTEKILEKKENENKYNFLPVVIFLIIFYIITHILSKKKIISVVNHRKFWNVLLLFTFLGVGLSGIFLILRINYNLIINWPFNLLYWHVEIGLVMTMISIFHTLWHWPYYKNMVKFNRKRKTIIQNK